MYFDRQTRALKARLRPLQYWFDSPAARVITLVVLILAFFVVQRVLG